jgi:hypothetical protein
MTNFNNILGIVDKRLDFKHTVAFSISMIFPYLIFISFILIVGRLIIGANSGIFGNDYLYGAILEIISNILLIFSLTLLISKTNFSTYLAVILSAAFSRLPDFIIGLHPNLIILNILTYVLLIILMHGFLARFEDFRKGILLAFVLAFVISKIVGNFMYAFHVYRHFGKTAIINNFENGEAIRKLTTDISSALILSLLFSIGLLLTYSIFGIKARLAQ